MSKEGRWRGCLPGGAALCWLLISLPLAGFLLLRESPSSLELGWLPRRWSLWLDTHGEVRTLLLSFGLCILPAVFLAGRASRRWMVLGVIVVVLVVAEIAQHWIPSRTFSWGDLRYTLLGAAGAELVAWMVVGVGSAYRRGLSDGGAQGSEAMRVLIYGLNYAPELTGIGRYTGELGPWLQRAGVEVRVVTTPPYYPQWEIAKGYRRWWFTREEIEGVPVWRCPFYVPARPTTVKRLVHLASFAGTSFLGLWRHLAWRPDLVLMVEPASMTIPGGLVFARVAGAKTWLHVQDFEMDAMLGLGMGERTGVRGQESADRERESGGRERIVIRAARWGEAWMKRRFDRVSSISRVMMSKLEERGVRAERIGFFPNWVDVDFMAPGIPRRDFKREWGIPEERVMVLYSGNIGKKQGLGIVLDVAQRLEDERGAGRRFEFVIVGDGAAREELEREAVARGLKCVHFHPLQPYEDLPDLLRSADLHLVIQKKGAADAVLPSKLTSILSVGGWCIITAEAHTELGRLAEEVPEMVEVIEPEEPEALLAALGRMGRKEGRGINAKARQYAEEQLERDAILTRVLKEMEELTG